MPVSIIGPKFYAWDANGEPLAFGKVYTYQARTNNPKATYQSEDGIVANTNPVILNGEGYADIYLDGSYKIVVKDIDDNERWTADPVTANQADEWVNCVPVTYTSSTSFTISGNFVDQYEPGRRVRIDNNVSEFAYSTIQSSILSGPNTVVTVSDSVVLTGVVGSCVSVIGVDSIPSLNFDTVSELEESNLNIGLKVSTNGYAVAGDGGGSEYLTAAPQAVDEEGSFTLANGNVALLQIKGDIHAMQFGIFPDVVDNKTPAILAAIDATIAHQISLKFAPGEYVFDGITRTLDAGKVSIVCDSGMAIFKGTADLVAAGGRMFRFENSSALSSPITVTSSVEVREDYIEVSDTSEIEAGMVFHIASNILWPYDNRGAYFKGEKHLVKRVDAGLKRVYFYDLVRDNYTIAEITTIQAWNPNHYDFKGIKADMSEFGGVVGFQLNRSAFDCIDNVEAAGKEGESSTAGIWLLDCMSPRVSNYIARNIGGGTGGGYGIQDRGCVGLILDGFESYGCRRAFDAHSQSGTNSSPSRDCLVTNFKIYGGGDYWPVTAVENYGIGNHGTSENVRYGNGEIHDCLTAINFRGVKQTLNDIDIYGACNYLVDLSYGAGVDAINVNYRPEGYPNKGATLGELTTFYMPICLLRLGRASTSDANADMLLPVTLKGCDVVGVVTSAIFSDGVDQPVNNVRLYGNTIEPKTSATPFYMVSANGSFFDCSFEGNSIIRRTRDVALANVPVFGGKEPVIVDGTYYAYIADQSASTVGTFLTPDGARLTFSISGDTLGRGIYEFRANSATHTIAGAITFTNLEATASPDSLDGTFGTNGKFTIGLTPEGKLVAENRIGTNKVWRFKLLA